MNVDRMRRYAAQTQQYAEQNARRRWLASLTPEHRAIHQHPMYLGCSICMQVSARKMGEALAAAFPSARRSA